jgi:ketosteroid isomerase-like protein
MSAEENMALVRRFLEARVKGDLDAVDEMIAVDFVSHTTQIPGQAPDREGQIWATIQFTSAVSNASVHFEDQISRRRQGGDPHHLARHPRPRGAYGRCA